MASGPQPSPDETPASDGPADRYTRLRRWLLSYGLYVETLLGALLLAVALVSIVVVFFGAITALPTGPPPEGGESGANGTSSILDFGNMLINGGILLALGLGGLLLVHAAVELWTAIRFGRGLDFGDGTDLAYAGIRSVQTLTAAAFVAPILAGAALSRLGVVGTSPSNALLLVLAVSGLAMLASVFSHAVARAVRLLVRA